MRGELAKVRMHRFGWGILGGITLPYLLLHSPSEVGASFSDAAVAMIVAAAFLASLAGELCERYLFFTAAVAPRMPGGLQ